MKFSSSNEEFLIIYCELIFYSPNETRWFSLLSYTQQRAHTLIKCWETSILCLFLCHLYKIVYIQKREREGLKLLYVSERQNWHNFKNHIYDPYFA